MYSIQYKANYNAINTDKNYNQITMSLPDTLIIKPRSSICLSMPVEINLPEDWDCLLNINPLLDHPPLLTNSIPHNMMHHIILFNPTDDELFYSKDTKLFNLTFYKKSIVLAGVSYDKSNNRCTFGFDQLESSFVKVPVEHISFENLYIQETE